jgi:hypothetical protein
VQQGSDAGSAAVEPAQPAGLVECGEQQWMGQAEAEVDLGAAHGAQASSLTPPPSPRPLTGASTSMSSKSSGSASRIRGPTHGGGAQAGRSSRMLKTTRRTRQR